MFAYREYKLVFLDISIDSLLEIGKNMDQVTGREKAFYEDQKSKRECQLSEEIDEEFEEEKQELLETDEEFEEEKQKLMEKE